MPRGGLQVDADGTVAVDGPPPPDTAAPILSILVAGTRHGITLLEAEVSNGGVFAPPPPPQGLLQPQYADGRRLSRHYAARSRGHRGSSTGSTSARVVPCTPLCAPGSPVCFASGMHLPAPAPGGAALTRLWRSLHLRVLPHQPTVPHPEGQGKQSHQNPPVLESGHCAPAPSATTGVFGCTGFRRNGGALSTGSGGGRAGSAGPHRRSGAPGG